MPTGCQLSKSQRYCLRCDNIRIPQTQTAPAHLLPPRRQSCTYNIHRPYCPKIFPNCANKRKYNSCHYFPNLFDGDDSRLEIYYNASEQKISCPILINYMQGITRVSAGIRRESRASREFPQGEFISPEYDKSFSPNKIDAVGSFAPRNSKSQPHNLRQLSCMVGSGTPIRTKYERGGYAGWVCDYGVVVSIICFRSHNAFCSIADPILSYGKLNASLNDF